MFSAVRKILHDLIVKSGFFYYVFFPIIKKMFFLLPMVKPNHYIVDEGGSKINATKFGGKIFPPVATSRLSDIKDIRIRRSDVLIAGYPKTGCHWTFEILHMLLNKTLSLSKYGKEFGGMFDVMPLQLIESIPSPRILNTHMLYGDLPRGIQTRKTKIVLTVRCAKDTVVSYYNHNKNLSHVYGYDGKFENYFKLFMAGKLEYGDFFKYYHDWNKIIASNPVNEIFLLDFNELKKDPVTTIKRVAKFLGVEITHQGAADISEASSFKSMKKVRSTDSFSAVFLRKGIVGDWKNWMDGDQKEEIDRKWKAVEEECRAIIDRQNGSVALDE